MKTAQPRSVLVQLKVTPRQTPKLPNPRSKMHLGNVHPDDKCALQEEFSNSIEEKLNYHIEHRIIREDGSLCYVKEMGEHSYHKDGQIIKTVGIVLDISKEKELEHKLLQLLLNIF